MTVRTRIAPSPTGELHIGNLRTLLYNYAFAKQKNGKFILRVEDTDQKRVLEGVTAKILSTIRNYKIEWDEGPIFEGKPTNEGSFKPYIQSHRLDIYAKYAKELLNKGHAYYCFCSEERLKALKDSQNTSGKQFTKYDRNCLNLTKKEIETKLNLKKKYVIRLKVPDNEIVSFNDLVYGTLSFNSNDIDDQILIKSDGFPTYHMAVVVDDHLMEITHILRGNDWLPSTPKHVILYKALGWKIPKIAHLPNLKEINSTKKLSKRFGATFAQEFLNDGYLPEAVINFLMFLGWNPGTEKEIYSLEEFIQDFSIERIHKTDLVVFNREKLLWYNGYYIRNKSSEELLQILEKWIDNNKVEVNSKFSKFSAEYKQEVLSLIKDRMKTLKDFNYLSDYFFSKPLYDKINISKYGGLKTKQILEDFVTIFNPINKKDWNTQNLDKTSHNLITLKNYNIKEALMTLRVAVTGETATPSIFEIIQILQKEQTLTRLNDGIKIC